MTRHMVMAAFHLRTYIITEGFSANLVAKFETALPGLVSLSGGEVVGVNVGGSGKESRLADSEFWTDEQTLL
jgi:hypothetical protein